jgi:16S rRNA (cytidine1402-2'-O)-methyltransferase
VSGTLFIVATPIGNLEDITLRALRVLKEVDLIACEDTRHTKILLDHYGIRGTLVSFFEHNEDRRTPEILERLNRGDSVAVVCDAGTPTISDPAFKLVRAAREAGLPVVAVPGASAVIAALSVSGLPTDSFTFVGFLPQKKGRQTAWKQLAGEERTLVLYESPHRLLRLLSEVETFLGDRVVVVGRELTKKFEEVISGDITWLQQHFEKHPPKGEMVVLVEGKRHRIKRRRRQGADPDEAGEE